MEQYLNTVSQGDCLELMQDLPDRSIDLICVDPPYGTTSRNAWDIPIDNAALFSQFDRLIKPKGVIACFACQPFATDVINAYRKYFRYDLVWRKTRPVGFLNANRQPMRSHESILLFYKESPTYNPQKTAGDPYRRIPTTNGTNYGESNPDYVRIGSPTGERFPTSVLTLGKGREKHPTAKPVPLLEWIVKTYTNAGDVVLDPTCGTGSALIASAMHGRGFIGFDLSEAYCEIARQRIQAALL